MAKKKLTEKELAVQTDRENRNAVRTAANAEVRAMLDSQGQPLTWDEFEEICIDSVRGLDYSYDSDTFHYDDGKIIQKHETGGASGGNCWGDSAERYSNSKSEDAFKPLDTILTKVCPNITYLKYREIESLLMEDQDSDREYYGNYTNYTTYTLDIGKLYDTIIG